MARFVFQSLVKWLYYWLKDCDFWWTAQAIKTYPTPEEQELKKMCWDDYYSLRNIWSNTAMILLSNRTEVNNG